MQDARYFGIDLDVCLGSAKFTWCEARQIQYVAWIIHISNWKQTKILKYSHLKNGGCDSKMLQFSDIVMLRICVKSETLLPYCNIFSVTTAIQQM